MLRLIERLAKDGHIKSIKTILKLGETSKQLHFVCEPNLSAADSVVKSAIEQAKVKFFSMPVAAKNSTTWFKSNKTPLDGDFDSDANAKDDDDDDDDDGDNEKVAIKIESSKSSAQNKRRKRISGGESSTLKRSASPDDPVDAAAAASDIDEGLDEVPKKKQRRRGKSGSPSFGDVTLGGIPPSVQQSFEKVRSRLGPTAGSQDAKDKATTSSSSAAAAAAAAAVEGKSATEKEKVAGDSKVLEYVPGISKKYGVLPKMKRLQVW